MEYSKKIVNSKDVCPLPVPQKNNIRVKTDLTAQPQLLSWFEQFNYPPIPPQTWMECQLALSEGFTNAVRHAHKNRAPEIPIDIEVSIFPNHIEIRIWDDGQPFDLEQWVKNMPPQVDNNAEGGRGIKLMHQIADRLSYTKTAEGRNCLLIVKHYPQFLQGLD